MRSVGMVDPSVGAPIRRDLLASRRELDSTHAIIEPTLNISVNMPHGRPRPGVDISLEYRTKFAPGAQDHVRTDYVLQIQDSLIPLIDKWVTTHSIRLMGTCVTPPNELHSGVYKVSIVLQFGPEDGSLLPAN